MLTAGQLIWASFRPLLRLAFCVSAGFFLTKADRFPPVAARGAGQAILNIALPCLMFSKIVPAFSTDNAGAIGPLILVSLVYEAFGVVISWFTREFFWVPHRFRYGIYVAGGWGNWGDIPTSVILSVTGASPFNGSSDQTLSVAYISVFILVYMVTLFPCGAHHWIAKDFVGPDVEPEEVKAAARERRRSILKLVPRAIRSASTLRNRRQPRDLEKDRQELSQDREQVNAPIHEQSVAQPGPPTGEIEIVHRPVHHKHVSFVDDATTAVPTDGGILSTPCSPTPTEVGISRAYPAPSVGDSIPAKPAEQQAATQPSQPSRKDRMKSLIRTLISILDPPSIVIILSIIIALVNPLKALFVPVPSVHMHPAPDGQPPLAFVTDAATFIGAASVPLGLICLGSALARLNVPKDEWRALPLGAISSLAIGKLIVSPIFGVGLVKGLVHGGLIAKDDKVLQFVCVFFSCLPTSSTQVLLTQVYSGTGSAEHLPPFLIPQYIIMFITMTGLTAYTLQSLF